MDKSIDLKHYNVELEPQNVKNARGLTEQLGATVALDGNSQLFLALRDMSNEKFINKLTAATNAPDTKVSFVLSNFAIRWVLQIRDS